ncbi:transcriptional regulator [Sphingomonas deserti]|uniref:Transcriptional regulator n=2 Tax=Allosphingosinicella deserti TaxID=2116704 RepID=A0A2P7QHD3_9SPHN|nr:transcriptional regulator [Sphingomonas deserti]
MSLLFAPDKLDSVFAALADPTRRAILARLARGEATITELAKPLRVSQPAVSQHIKLLVGAGMVRQRVDGVRRPCRLSSEGLGAADQWLAMLRKGLEANYERLDALLSAMDATEEGTR